jgi:rod shape-determining protein MreC
MRTRIIILGILGACILLLRQDTPVRTGILTATLPLQRATARNVNAVSTRVGQLQQIPLLFSEQARLQAAIADLQLQLRDRSSLAAENAALREELKVANRPATTKLLVAPIRARSFRTETTDQGRQFTPTLTVSIGREAGVVAGSAVTVLGHLIGRVSTVETNQSEITLITGETSRIQVELDGSKEKGLLKGSLAGNLFITDVTQGIQVPAGTLVLTSGLGGTLPQGIPIGTVTETITKANEQTQELALTSPINLDLLEYVMIVP